MIPKCTDNNNDHDDDEETKRRERKSHPNPGTYMELNHDPNQWLQ